MSSLTEVRRDEKGSPPRDEQPRSDIAVVSHDKDADGITAAALVHHLTGASIRLTDYAQMVSTVSKVDHVREVFICDLGLNKTTFGGFLDEVKRLAQRAKVHYIDHHPIVPEYEQKLRDVGVDVFHSKEESAAVLIYQKYEQELKTSPKMKVLACCGAITDYMDLQPFAKKLVASFDRQFLLYEATVLAFSIAMIGREGESGNRLLVQMVEDLGARDKFPHEIDNASYYSQEFASHSAALIDKAKRDGKRMNNFAYQKTRESSTGNVANFIIGAFDVPVGVAFREDGPDHYEISLRSTNESNYDLGVIVGRISGKLEASGGGHMHAAGSRIRRDQFDDFVSLLDSELGAPPK